MTAAGISRRAALAAALGGTAGALLAAPQQAEASSTMSFGAYVPDPYWDWKGWPAQLDAYTARVGRAPSILHWFAAWGGQPAYPAATTRLVRARGAIPLMTWEPWDWTKGAAQPDYRLSRITGGAFDAYLRTFA